MRREQNRFYVAIILLISIILVGIFGYMSIEDFTFIEASFMTIITISTVGFREVHPLSEAGQIFTAMLIIISFGVFAYAITSITRYILDGEIRKYLKNYRVNKKIDKIKDHVIICGYGRNGKQATIELTEHKIPLVVVENSEQVIEKIDSERKLLFFQGDSTHEDVLERVKIQKAKALITTLPNDADNLFVVLTARGLNPDLKIISRASKEESKRKLKKAGADEVIMPDYIGGQQMAKLVTQPDIVEFLDYIMLQSHFDVNLEEITCESINTCFINYPINNLIEKNDSGANIIGLKNNGKYIFNLSDEITLTKNVKLFILGSPDQIKKLKSIITNG